MADRTATRRTRWTTSTTTPRRPASRGRRCAPLRGLLAGGTAGATALVAVILLAAPLASAHGTVTYSAPFSGFTVVPAVYTSQSGCAAEKQPTPATWNSTTGVFQASSSTGTGRCAISNVAQVYSAFEIVSPVFHTPAAGFGYVYVSVSSAFSARASVHLPAPANVSNGTYVYAEASVSLSVAVYIYDVTPRNGSLFGYGIDTLVSQYFTTTGKFLLTTSWTNSTLYATGTFARGHVYQAQLEVTSSVFVDTFGGGASAFASLDAAGTNGVSIGSVTAY